MRFVSYYPGATSHATGVTAALWGWAAALVDAEQEVLVLHAGGPRRSPDPCHARPGLTDRAIPHRGNSRRTYRAIGLERYLRPDDVLILHEGWVLSNLVAALAARRAGCQYVVVPHGAYDPGIRKALKPPRRLRQIVEQWILERAAAIHVFFDSEGPIIRGIASQTPPLIVAPTGFDIGEERWTGGGGYLAWIGRYARIHKGLDLLVGAVAVELRGPDFEGGFAQTRDHIERLGLGQWIHAEGPVSGREKADFLARSNGYVMPSRWESHSIALVENLAIGAPCLVSDALHIAGPLATAGAAILTPLTEEGIANGLRRLAAENVADLGERGRSFVRSSLAWPEVIAAFLNGIDRSTRGEVAG
jgi:glycosyltransferase involved in cell wall biosynthesis